MIQEFKEFVNKGNFIDLAVGFVMGLAVSNVVTTMVERLVMPLVALAVGERSAGPRSSAAVLLREIRDALRARA